MAEPEDEQEPTLWEQLEASVEALRSNIDRMERRIRDARLVAERAEETLRDR